MKKNKNKKEIIWMFIKNNVKLFAIVLLNSKSIG